MRTPYGLTEDELYWVGGDVATALENRYRDAMKPLSNDEKKTEWKNLFMGQVEEHRKDLKVWCDGDNKLWLGWYRTDHAGVKWIIIRALIQLKSQTLVAVPLRKESTDVAWSRPWMGVSVYEKAVKPYRLIIPKGTF